MMAGIKFESFFFFLVDMLPSNEEKYKLAVEAQNMMCACVLRGTPVNFFQHSAVRSYKCEHVLNKVVSQRV